MAHKLDILAPAGSFAMLKAAVYAGADSVYLGISGFNARRTAENFTEETLPLAVSFCHGRGVKVNVALNTVLQDAELPALCRVIRAVAQSGADAIILQDMAVAKLAKAIAPDLPRHASTQMSVTDLSGAKLLAEAGFSRVILARELTRDEIRHITANCGIETEIFIHGAHCMCVSGQCYMSAFFGGRSGNRGACAGPCRLPYSACGESGPLLGLKDLSLMDHLEEIEKMGVACVKIEGRLRTPEYVAAAVTAARRQLEGEVFDRQLLDKAFSRSGFTAGFYENDYLTGRMFGRRTEADGAATKAALPALRELFRREFSKIAADFTLSLENNQLTLTVTDGENTASVTAAVDCQPAKNPLEPAVRRSLEKCGGTPFYARDIRCSLPEGVYFPLSAVNELRRQALEELLALREVIRPYAVNPAPALPPRREKTAEKQALWARFAKAEQLTEPVASLLDGWTVPLAAAEKISPALRDKTVLALPRAVFDEEEILAQIAAAARLGYDRFEAQSVCGIGLIRQAAPGAKLRVGFGCNVINTTAQLAYEEWGAEAVTLSPETPLSEAGRIGGNVPRGVLAYGHLPLMLVRACPLRAVTDCAACKGEGTLRDRKGQEILVECRGAGKNGSRQLLNPIPLWLGDRRRELGCDFAVLYFTKESPERVAEVLRMYTAGEAFDGTFTRGLAYKSIFEAE